MEKRFTDQLGILLRDSRYNLSCAVGRAEETKRDKNLAAFIASERVTRDVINDVAQNRKQVTITVKTSKQSLKTRVANMSQTK
jgi:hypothetical protein